MFSLCLSLCTTPVYKLSKELIKEVSVWCRMYQRSEREEAGRTVITIIQVTDNKSFDLGIRDKKAHSDLSSAVVKELTGLCDWFDVWEGKDREKSGMIFFKDFNFLILFLDRGEGREKERNIEVWLPIVRLLLGTWPATQACALVGNQTRDPLVHRPALNPLSHTSQG